MFTSNKLVKKMEHPIRTKMTIPVTRCSITPINLADSPGTDELDIFLSAITWFIDKTVAATNHGKPRSELMPMQIAQTNKSK